MSRRDIHIEYTPHAYWPSQPHTMPQRIQSVLVCMQEPVTAIRLLLRDLNKRADCVRVARSRAGGVAIVTVDGEPVPLAYVEVGLTFEEAAAALLAARRAP